MLTPPTWVPDDPAERVGAERAAALVAYLREAGRRPLHDAKQRIHAHTEHRGTIVVNTLSEAAIATATVHPAQKGLGVIFVWVAGDRTPAPDIAISVRRDGSLWWQWGPWGADGYDRVWRPCADDHAALKGTHR